ncbi:hypothetical protein PCASD_26529 [Puccinia coronata f. sp. avenae]|uniref:Vacuolar sorting protein Vps3844 C-terminal domain-containing protein n=1 Tax=Puccinia coronata f. sp. avenae TaxID=200324 RepID=A0A2N5RUH3_9BASI|nr:hypothetical protein PCASD_26529 [Puccinia coronata f. sp. avenae]
MPQVMNRFTSAVLLLLPSLASGQLNAHLYLRTLAPTQTMPVPLSTPELNAILSHRLNISHFESLPASLHPTTIKSQLVLGHTTSDLPQSEPAIQQSKLLVALYGNDGQTVLPEEFLTTMQSFSIPNPPDTLSFDALMAIYVGRMVDTMRVPLDTMYGVQAFVQAYHDGMGLDLRANLDDQSVNPEIRFREAIKEYGALDAPAYQLLDDLNSLDRFVHSSQWGPVSFLRLSGLQQVRQRHGESSLQYRVSLGALKASLEAVLGDARVQGMETMVVAVPGQPTHARLGKRTSLSILSPFKTSEQSFVRRDLIDRRRSVFGSAAASMPIIPSSRTCFATKDACLSATDACNGHGSCTQGVKTSGGKCFACLCQKSNDVKTGKVTYWSGDSCQKQDISSGFVLLLGSAIALVLLFALAVRMLASVGSESLPQQLASINGHSKKID